MVRLLVCSDFHLKVRYPKSEGFNAMLERVENPWDNLLNILGRANEFDAVLMVGDLCNDGEIEDYEKLKKILKQNLEKPVILTLGNHDIRRNFNKVFDYGNNKYRDVLVINDIAIISFDTSEHGVSNGILTNEEFEWLKGQIKKFKDKKIIIMTHHHLVKEQAGIPVLPQAEQIKDVLSENIKLIITGHTHHFYEGSFCGIPYVTVGSTALAGFKKEDGRVMFTTDTSYLEVEINNEVRINKVILDDSHKILGYTVF